MLFPMPMPISLDDPKALELLSALEAVPAGFPSPAQDYFSGELDLADRLVRDRASTFVWRVSGHSMTGASINDQDLLLVDRGIAPVSGRIVVAIVDAEFVVKRLVLHRGRPTLHSENPDYPDVVLAELSEMTIWGVVTWVLHPAL